MGAWLLALCAAAARPSICRPIRNNIRSVHLLIFGHLTDKPDSFFFFMNLALSSRRCIDKALSSQFEKFFTTFDLHRGSNFDFLTLDSFNFRFRATKTHNFTICISEYSNVYTDVLVKGRFVISDF